MKPIVYIFSILLLLSCGSKQNNTIASEEDYDKYLVAGEVKTTSKYFELWNSKIKPDSVQLLSFANVAGEYSRYFKKTGNIEYLKKAEQALSKAVEIANIDKSGYRRALARNYISQHRFREALVLAKEAEDLGSHGADSKSLFFDLHMELGNYKTAKKYLDSIKNMSDFGYLIRLSKWNDYKGDLETTITFMEKAKEKAESANNKELMIWSYTNLADYYGHAGRIDDSYQHYLKSLQLDPHNAYAKKGIAWIVFSNDKNPKEALRILDSVTKGYDAPDNYLLKAEIASYLGNDIQRLESMDAYFSKVRNPNYGDIYNAYNLNLYVNETQQFDKAITLAQKEVQNRPTPESYSWLAYSYLMNGKKQKAKELIDTYVLNKTFEPALLYHVAKVYKANGELDKVKELKGELMGSLYELGPNMEKQIQDL
jgi:tetratricopeptide (TPR) repeat protein